MTTQINPKMIAVGGEGDQLRTIGGKTVWARLGGHYRGAWTQGNGLQYLKDELVAYRSGLYAALSDSPSIAPDGTWVFSSGVSGAGFTRNSVASTDTTADEVVLINNTTSDTASIISTDPITGYDTTQQITVEFQVNISGAADRLQIVVLPASEASTDLGTNGLEGIYSALGVELDIYNKNLNWMSRNSIFTMQSGYTGATSGYETFGFRFTIAAGWTTGNPVAGTIDFLRNGTVIASGTPGVDADFTHGFKVGIGAWTGGGTGVFKVKGTPTVHKSGTLPWQLVADLTGTGGGSSSALTVQDENTNVATAVTQIDFQGAGVTATSGTGEVIVTIPDNGTKTLYDAKGDILVATGNDTPARLAVGADGQVLTADSTAAAGMKWAALAMALANLTDVGVSGVTNGQLLGWDSTAGKWRPYSVSTGGATNLDGLTDVDTTTVAPTDGQVLKYNAASGLWKPAADATGSGSSGSSGPRTAVLKYNGTVTGGVGATRFYNDTGAAWTILGVRATVETAPSGGTVVVDVNINGTTIFTTQANRPTIAAGASTSGKVTAIDVTSVPDGSYLTVDVDVTTSPAANLTVTVVLG